MNLLRQLLLNNLTLKGISVLLALLLWFQIAGQQEVQRMISVPLEFINMPDDLVITNDYPREIDVLISRPGAVRMDERNLAALVDLSGTQPGTAVVPVTERSLRNIPSGVKIGRIEQRRIRLVLERLRQKSVSVEPEIIGEPAEGFQVREVRVSPSMVPISGPESHVEKVTEARTEPIDITGRSQSFNQTVYLDLEDQRLRFENTSSVDVLIMIEEERKEQKMRLTLTTGPEGPRVRFSPRSVQAVISVPISFEEKLNSTLFKATVELQGELTSGRKIEADPIVVIPDEYREVARVESVSPAKVTVTVR